jgi:hypothetical protein
MPISKYHCYFTISTLLVTVWLNIATATVPSAVTVYRCVDAKGKISLQDVPCSNSNEQEVRKMARPKDAPPNKTSTNNMPLPAPQIAPSYPVQLNSPSRPAPDLYKCTDFDGKVRESETYDPRPRCVPLWVQGYQSPSNVCSWVEDSCLRYEGKQLCDRWKAKQKQAVLNADRPSAENTDFKKAEAARLTQIVKDSCQ